MEEGFFLTTGTYHLLDLQCYDCSIFLFYYLILAVVLAVESLIMLQDQALGDTETLLLQVIGSVLYVDVSILHAVHCVSR